MTQDKHTWCVIMAGGLGSRFWPVSRTDNPKQFIDVTGVGRSMLQLTFERYERICPKQNIVIVTGKQYADRVREQLPDLLPYQVLAEPLRRNTAPCIAYAAAVIGQIDPEATLIVSPSDHAIFHREKFRADMEQALQTVAEHDWIITLGAQPVRPETSYGYIQFNDEPSLPGADESEPRPEFSEAALAAGFLRKEEKESFALSRAIRDWLYSGGKDSLTVGGEVWMPPLGVKSAGKGDSP